MRYWLIIQYPNPTPPQGGCSVAGYVKARCSKDALAIAAEVLRVPTTDLSLCRVRKPDLTAVLILNETTHHN